MGALDGRSSEARAAVRLLASVESDLADNLSTADRSTMRKLARNETLAAQIEVWLDAHPDAAINGRRRDTAPLVEKYLKLQARIEEQYKVLHSRVLKRNVREIAPLDTVLSAALRRQTAATAAPTNGTGPTPEIAPPEASSAVAPKVTT